jgi:hypothetical protein
MARLRIWHDIIGAAFVLLEQTRELPDFAFSSATAGQATSRLRPGRGRAEWSLNFRAN